MTFRMTQEEYDNIQQELSPNRNTKHKTAWMTPHEFEEWAADKKLGVHVWQIINALRWHSAKKFVMETGHPIARDPGFTHPPRTYFRPIIRYTVRKKTVINNYGRHVVRLQVTVKQLSEGSK